MKAAFQSLLVIAIVLIAAGSASAEKRVALVIGNDSYPALGAEEQLRKAVNDAHAVGDTLESLGFEVTRAEDVSRGEMLSLILATATKLQPGDIAFFFFAGHGVSIDGANYLLPSDIPEGTGGEDLIRFSAISEAMVVETLKAKAVRVAMVVLDACRNNPFSQGGTRAFGDGTRGLSRPPTVQTEGVFGLYSAGFGEQALDRLGDEDPDPNSVFTRVLVPALRQPGLSLIDVAYAVNEDVARLARSVGHEQNPAYYDQARGRDIVLLEAPEQSQQTGQAGPEAQRERGSDSDPCAAAQLHFDAARELGRVEALEDHVSRFPQCQFAALARMLIESLEGRPGEQVAALTPPDSRAGEPGAPADDGTLLAECKQAAADPATPEEIAAAIDACTRAHERVPGDALTMHLLGNSYNASSRYEEAVDWYRKAADLGLPEAQNSLGLKYDAGEGVVLDDREAARLYRLAAEQGLAVAQYNLGLMYHYGEGVPRDTAEAAHWYRLAAGQGRADAQNRLALLYDAGDGVELNDVEAVRLYRLAADQGFAAAQHNLGLMYGAGEGVPEDRAEAIRWHRLAADQGYLDAQNALGLAYDLGNGVPVDDVEAVRWYRIAAEQGHAAAQHNLGLMYDNGEGVAQDEAEAIRWYRMAAEQGHADAQNRLALKYDSGSGVPLDDVEAIKWFRAAADQGLAVAQYNLALMYDYGEGTARSEVEAVRWFRLSADQGFADASWELGMKYLRGAGGLPSDATQAARHFLDALRNQSNKAKEALVDRRARDLSPQARREIQRALKAEGAYAGSVDGVFGQGTLGALQVYTQRH